MMPICSVEEKVEDDYIRGGQALMLELPSIGFGTADLGDGTEEAVFTALCNGYRLIDTARAYDSEAAVGKALNRVYKENGSKRSDYIIQTKLSPSVSGYDETLADFEQSLESLNTEYVDVYFIHWPVIRGNEKTYHKKNVETCKAFEKLYGAKKVKRLGVCNFLERHLADIWDNCNVRPTVHQLEIHPGYQQIGLVEYSQKLGMKIEAWSPMGRGELKNRTYIDMADRYGCNIGQLALKWSLQKGYIPLSRSQTKDHIINNKILDFTIAKEDMNKIDELNTNTNYLNIWSYKRQQMY